MVFFIMHQIHFWPYSDLRTDSASRSTCLNTCRSKTSTEVPVSVCLWWIQIKSNLGRLILKEEKEKAVHFRRKTQSLPDRTHMHTSKTDRRWLSRGPVFGFRTSPSETSFLPLFTCRFVCGRIEVPLTLRLDQSKFPCVSTELQTLDQDSLSHRLNIELRGQGSADAWIYNKPKNHISGH